MLKIEVPCKRNSKKRELMGVARENKGREGRRGGKEGGVTGMGRRGARKGNGRKEISDCRKEGEK